MLVAAGRKSNQSTGSGIDVFQRVIWDLALHIGKMGSLEIQADSVHFN